MITVIVETDGIVMVKRQVVVVVVGDRKVLR